MTLGCHQKTSGLNHHLTCDRRVRKGETHLARGRSWRCKCNRSEAPPSCSLSTIRILPGYILNLAGASGSQSPLPPSDPEAESTWAAGTRGGDQLPSGRFPVSSGAYQGAQGVGPLRYQRPQALRAVVHPSSLRPRARGGGSGVSRGLPDPGRGVGALQELLLFPPSSTLPVLEGQVQPTPYCETLKM